MIKPAGRLGWIMSWPRATCLVAGALAALALPPFDLWPVVFPAFTLVCAVVAVAPSARSAFVRGWCAGLGWFGVAMHWIVQPFFVEPEVYGWMAPFALVIMAGGLALFWGLAAWGAARISATNGWPRILAFVGLLTLLEAARGRIFSGLPWAQPGHGLVGSDLLALSAYVGPLGLTFVLLAVAGLGAGLLLANRPLVAALPVLGGIGLGFAPLTPVPLPIADDAAVVRIVQINAPQHLKWDSEMIPVFYDRALTLTAAPAGPLGAPDLVVWPETSLPDLLDRSERIRADIAAVAGGARIMVGGQRYSGIEPRNVMALLTPQGGFDQIYDKHHLVPFGEYLPLRGLAQRWGFDGLAAQLSGGYFPGAGPALMDLGPLGQAFPMICYEAIFPHYIQTVARPDLMVIVTNDAWFGSFAMPYQHLALARLRAAEQGLPVIRAANTGISAMIDGRGQVTHALEMNVAGHIDAPLPLPRAATLYARTGDWPIWGFAVGFVLAGIGISRAIESRRKGA